MGHYALPAASRQRSRSARAAPGRWFARKSLVCLNLARVAELVFGGIHEGGKCLLRLIAIAYIEVLGGKAAKRALGPSEIGARLRAP